MSDTKKEEKREVKRDEDGNIIEEKKEVKKEKDQSILLFFYY